MSAPEPALPASGVAVAETTQGEQGRLSAHLGLPGATVLAITVVVGSGALVLPGIAYRQAGADAAFAWIVAAAVTIPLLVVFARLGARYPGAGGVAGFAHAGFGRTAAAAVEVLMLGTFSLGIPAIALTGGNYVVRALDLSIKSGPAAAVLVLGAGAVVAIGVRLSGRLQTALALMLTVGLLCAALLALRNPVTPVSVHVPTDTSQLFTVAATVGTVFFAFTGWEVISFTTEEYRNPQRDFPRVLVLSFVIVTAMYILLAIGLQAQLPATDPGLSGAPVGDMVEQAAGSGAAQATTVLGIVAIAANLVGAFWGASRLVMASARAGLLPRPLARVRAHRQLLAAPRGRRLRPGLPGGHRIADRRPVLPRHHAEPGRAELLRDLPVLRARLRPALHRLGTGVRHRGGRSAGPGHAGLRAGVLDLPAGAVDGRVAGAPLPRPADRRRSRRQLAPGCWQPAGRQLVLEPEHLSRRPAGRLGRRLGADRELRDGQLDPFSDAQRHR